MIQIATIPKVQDKTRRTCLVLFITKVRHALGLVNPGVPDNRIWEACLPELNHLLGALVCDLQTNPAASLITT